MAYQSPIVIPAVKNHTATVIMAHGLGDSGAGWSNLGHDWHRKSMFEEVKFIFPHAPRIPITVNSGAVMPAWFDITRSRDKLAFDELQLSQDETGILKSRDYFFSLINDEISSGIPSNRIVFGGFSQGAGMSLVNGITFPQKLGGIYCLSGYLLLQKSLLEGKYGASESPNKETPMFMGHGSADPMVKYEWAVKSRDALVEKGWNVELKVYPGLAHSVDPGEMKDLEKYLNERLPPIGDRESL